MGRTGLYGKYGQSKEAEVGSVEMWLCRTDWKRLLKYLRGKWSYL